jgi:signal transduction histidine kinase
MQATNGHLEHPGGAEEGRRRVLLVDDHPAMRDVLRSLLEEVGGWQVVGEAASGEEAVPLVADLEPDVVLMDCKMPGRGGVAATREIVRRWPRVAVVAHTAYADEAYVREMLAAGARGYVLKGDTPSTLLEALGVALHGGARLSAGVSGPVVDDLRALYEAARSRSAQLEAENSALSATVARLQEVDRVKDEFLAMISHELRTPITVLLGMAQTFARRPELAATPDGVDGLQRMVNQGRHLRDMVEQLLQASAFSANRSPALRDETVAVADVVAGVVAARRQAEPEGSGEPQGGAPEDRVPALRLELPERPRPMWGDAEALRAVVGNLVDNACRHAPPGTEVEVWLEQPPGWTRIEVADHGSGVAAGDRRRIFAPFSRRDPLRAQQGGGVGIGLFLVDRLVGVMGGRVWVEENPGGGARFVVEIPDLAPAG